MLIKPFNIVIVAPPSPSAAAVAAFSGAAASPPPHRPFGCAWPLADTPPWETPFSGAGVGELEPPAPVFARAEGKGGGISCVAATPQPRGTSALSLCVPLAGGSARPRRGGDGGAVRAQITPGGGQGREVLSNKDYNDSRYY